MFILGGGEGKGEKNLTLSGQDLYVCVWQFRICMRNCHKLSVKQTDTRPYWIFLLSLPPPPPSVPFQPQRLLAGVTFTSGPSSTKCYRLFFLMLLTLISISNGEAYQTPVFISRTCCCCFTNHHHITLLNKRRPPDFSPNISFRKIKLQLLLPLRQKTQEKKTRGN